MGSPIFLCSTLSCFQCSGHGAMVSAAHVPRPPAAGERCQSWKLHHFAVLTLLCMERTQALLGTA